MNSTKNIKGNRQVIVATFNPQELIFKLPDGLDLEDDTVVENYWVNWGILYIKCIGDDIEYKIDPEPVCEPDYKRPENIEIQSAENAGVEYSDDEEEDENNNDQQ